jgi:hypothetical protein
MKPNLKGEADMKQVNITRHNAHIHDDSNITSEQTRGYGFVPAFKDCSDGRVYISRNTNGTPAPIHKLDDLPKHLFVCLGQEGKKKELKKSVVAGFVRDMHFFSRSQAAALVLGDSLIEMS